MYQKLANVRKALPLALCFLITACATSPDVNINSTRPDYPDSLFICLSKPNAPVGQFTDADLAVFIARLEARGDDCAAKLKVLQDLLKKQKEAETK